MNQAEDPWELPSARAFLAEAAGLLDDGGGVLVGGASMPPGLPSGFEAFLHGRHTRLVVRRVAPDAAANPAATVAAAFENREIMDVAGLVADASLADHVALITPGGTSVASEAWLVFLRRFLDARNAARATLSVYLICSATSDKLGHLPSVAWRGRLRRLDITIWADLHAPLSRYEPLASLAEALAVELGAWRLDLAGAIAAAPFEDLLDPVALIDSWRGAAAIEPDLMDGVPTVCSIALLESGAMAELRQRIWRAQLRALFPWIEELRQRVIDRHRKRLIITQQQKLLGVHMPEDIEFGGIAYQLRSKVTPVEAEFLLALARLRNDLAHHRPVASGDLSLVLQNLKRAGYG